MNRIQQNYAMAKARLDAIKEQQNKNEAAFIRESGYVNDDGTVPSHLWMMDDETRFDELSEQFDSSDRNLFYKVRDAEKELKKAEDALIDFGLSVSPVEIRNTLTRNRNNWKIREQLVNLAFRLDATTVKGGALA